MGDLAFVGFYSLIIYIESIHVGLGVFSFCFFLSERMHMCRHVHLRSEACRRTFYLRRKKTAILVSSPVISILYILMSPCEFFRQEIEAGRFLHAAGVRGGL